MKEGIEALRERAEAAERERDELKARLAALRAALSAQFDAHHCQRLECPACNMTEARLAVPDAGRCALEAVRLAARALEQFTVEPCDQTACCTGCGWVDLGDAAERHAELFPECPVLVARAALRDVFGGES